MSERERKPPSSPGGHEEANRELAGESGQRQIQLLTEHFGAVAAQRYVQRKLTQRRAERVALPGAATQVHSAAEKGTSGGGDALPHFEAIQRSFGRHDVSQVQAHTDEAAAEGAAAMGAEAFATGNHVAFAGTPSLHTAAHEAAHVVQQRAGVQLKGGVGQEGDAYERHADDVADLVVQGKSSESLLNRHSGSSPVSAVQKVSKDSVEQPTEHASETVPDLSAALVQAITDARSAAERRTVLATLLQYLSGKGIVDAPNRTLVQYNDSENACAAVTQVAGMNDDDPVRITFYRNAFTSPAILYSTFRHELIHVAQRLLVPDEGEASHDDHYMHENIYNADVGVATRNTLQKSLQEIETHVWELDHSDETGIDADYRATTEGELLQYVTALIAQIKSERIVPNETYDYWKGYIYKAKVMVDDCHSENEELIEAKHDLAEAIENREQLIQNSEAMVE